MTYKDQWQKELRRITRFIKSATKRGFIFPDINIQQPKKITKASVNKLKKITPKSLYKKANYITQDTGEIISGTAGRTLERKRAAAKGIQTKKSQYGSRGKKGQSSATSAPHDYDIIISNLHDFVDSLEPEPRGNSPLIKAWMEGHKRVIHDLLYEQEEIEGTANFGYKLEKMANQGQNIQDAIYNVIFSSTQEQYTINLAEFIHILRGHALSAEELKDIENLSSDISYSDYEI